MYCKRTRQWMVTGSHKQWPAHLLATTQIDRTDTRRVWSFFWSAHTDTLVGAVRTPTTAFGGLGVRHIGQHICWPLHRFIGRARVAFGLFLLVGTYRQFWWASARLPQLALVPAIRHIDILADGTSTSGWQQYQHYRHHHRNNSVQQWLATTPILPAPSPDTCATLAQQHWHYPGSQSPTHNAYTRMVTAA